MSLSQSGPSCGVGWQQRDDYPYGTPDEVAHTDAILADKVLNDGEDAGWAWNYAVIQQTACPPVVVIPPVVVTPPSHPAGPVTSPGKPASSPTQVITGNTQHSQAATVAASSGLPVKHTAVTLRKIATAPEASLAYTGSDGMQTEVESLASGGFVAIGGLMVVLSKLRNRRKVRK